MNEWSRWGRWSNCDGQVGWKWVEGNGWKWNGWMKANGMVDDRRNRIEWDMKGYVYFLDVLYTIE
jgi:hypothetical protein